MGDEGFSAQPDLAAEFTRGLDTSAVDDDDWGDEPAQAKKIVVKIRDKAEAMSSGPIDASFLSGLGAPPPAGGSRRRGHQVPSAVPSPAVPDVPAAEPAASNTPGEAAPPLPARRPPPGLPSATPAIPAETPATIDTADGDAMKLPPKPAPRPVPPAVPVEAEHAATENTSSIEVHGNGKPAAPAQPAAEADDGFGDLARHASSEAQATPVESSFANFGGAPSPLELALQDKAELQSEVHDLEAQLVMAKVTIAELAAENSKLRHSLAAKGVKVVSEVVLPKWG